MRRLTTKEFIEKAIKIHGNKYIYDNVEISGIKNKVAIVCKTHGRFEQAPNNHLFGQGCRKCSTEKTAASKRMKASEEFLRKAINVHGDKYLYDKVIYEKSSKNVLITCRVHGDFSQTPNNHLSGNGCFQCGVQLRTYTQEEFIVKSNTVHDFKYNYEKVIYNHNKEEVIIICRIHGEFKQEAGHHMDGAGCPECGKHSRAKKLSLTNSEFIQKASDIHNFKYDYTLIDYIKSDTSVIIICKEHGKFSQKPNTHLAGKGCAKCGIATRANSLTKEKDEFIKQAIEVHGYLYDYSETDYNGNKNKIKIICNTHGEFKQSPGQHLLGHGCFRCKTKSNGELKIEKYLENNSINYVKEKKFPGLIGIGGRSLRFDFYIEKFNLIIEFDGIHHYKQIEAVNWTNDLNKTQEHDKIKNLFCKNNGISLLRIPYYELKNINKILNEIFKNV